MGYVVAYISWEILFNVYVAGMLAAPVSQGQGRAEKAALTTLDSVI